MILKKEILIRSEEWNVPADTVDKDYVLGHYLSVFLEGYPEQLLFKGGTCLRKCYFPGYHFSEDLDFSSISREFVLTNEGLQEVSTKLRERTGIITVPGPVIRVVSKDVLKGFQAKIKYWGANHDRREIPLAPERWNTSIKLEISIDEIILLPAHRLRIYHQYTDKLTGVDRADCYDLREIVSEKLRSLVQRSYTAPRDFFDIYKLTNGYSGAQWDEVKQYFFKKMVHKKIEFTGPDQLVDEESLQNVRKAWQKSLDYQTQEANDLEIIITYVHDTIHNVF